MKILFLTNKLPYPPRDGGSIATLNMLTGLRDAGNSITCLALNTSKHSFPVEKIPDEPGKSIRFMGVPCDSAIKPARMLLNLLFSRKPYIAVRFDVKAYRKRLRTLLKSESFDLVQLEGPYPGLYLEEIRKWSKAPVSLRAHNVEHLIWKRKAFHEKMLPKRWYLEHMAARLKKFELNVVRDSDMLIPITPLDEDCFRREGYSGPALTVPAGLVMEAYPFSPLPGQATLFFIGALDWLPNLEGLEWFMEHVFEKLIARIPHLQFHVAGRNAPAHFEEKIGHKNVTYHGEVEDARKFMQTYRVMVAPLLTGSGIRIKILESMALGRPVVTTSMGIRGIPAENHRDVLVSDDPDEFKDHLVNLFSSVEEADRLAAAARLLITHNFDTLGLSNRLNQFFKTQV